jgi:hypothetical protein
MAKRKPPAALFEVIHTSPPPPLNINRARRSWWFAPRATAGRAQVMGSLHPSMLADEPTHAPAMATATATCSPEAELRARFADASDSAHDVAVFSADEPEESDVADEPSFTPRPRLSSPVSEFCDGGLRIDRTRQELTFRLNYTTAALTAFIALVLMGLAFVVGKRLAESGDDPAITALRTGQPDPTVLSVDHGGSAAVSNLSGGASESNAPAPQINARESAPSPSDSGVAAGAVQRTIGLDYLVVQSYPDKKSAQDAADMLTQNGVPCTVEHGLKWAPNWYSVVTAAGYPPHSAEGDQLAASIHKVGVEQTKAGHRYRFDPQGYQWNQQ